jgi:hypothetical protein
MSMFKFGGADPDEEANIVQEMAGLRIELQRMNTENAMLRERIARYEVLSRPNDLILLTVKNFLFNVLYYSFSVDVITFQTAGTKYLDDNYPKKKKTTVDKKTGKTKTRTLKHLNNKERNVFSNMAKALYYDTIESNQCGNDPINMAGILNYTDQTAAKTFFDEVYVKMQEQLSNLAVGMAATNAKAEDGVNFISDDDEDDDE